MNQKTRPIKIKKVINTVMITFAILIFVLAIYIFAGAMLARKNNKPYQYFGYSLHVIATDSMTPEYNIGDMVFVKADDITAVKVGDNVLFKSLDPALKGNNILHKVVEVKNENGVISLVTSGTREDATADKDLVTEIIGIARGSNAFFGKVFLMFTTTSGLIALCVLTLGGVLVYKCIKNICKSTQRDKAIEAEDNGESLDGSKDKSLGTDKYSDSDKNNDSNNRS